MKYINKLAVAVLAGAALAACNDLDVQPVGGTITEDQKAQVVADNPEMAYASVTGIAGMMDAYNQLGAEDHYDFGYPALFIWMDMRGMDMYSAYSGYNWFLSPEQLSDGLSTSDGPIIPWKYCYNTIRSCNDLMTTLAESLESGEASSESLYSAAQALGFRAYAYFLLAQSFQFTYYGNEDKPCIPVITDLNAIEAATDGCGLSTVAEVYEQILSDLNTCIEYLGETTTRPSELVDNKYNRLVSKAVAYGLRARVNLVMNNWAEAAADAQAAINNFSGSPKSMAEASKPSFTSMDESDWMWGIAVAETDRTVTTGICNFPSMMGSFCYGYATAVGAFKWINNLLYAQIPFSDVRKGWWLDENGESANITAAQYDYVISSAESSQSPAPYIQVKFNSYQGVIAQSTNASDIPLMRVEEMYLILAEAQGMQNVSTGAQTLTNFVKQYRDPRYTCTATTPEDFQDAVWLQRRIELWGEGFSYYDMMRLKKPLDRVNAGWPAQCTYLVQPNDPVLIFPIPNSEITANKKLNAADNNNRGGSMPSPV